MAIVNPKAVNQLSKLLVCSYCHGDLRDEDTNLICLKCNHRFDVVGGIPRFIDLKTGSLDENDPIEHRQSYERIYQSAELAQGYNDSFVINPRDRKRTLSEYKILDSFLKSQKICDTILDIPCGGGRLSPALAVKCRHLLEMDASVEQVKLAVNVKSHNVPRDGISASALMLPLEDNSVDATLCARLSHHFPSIDERAQLLLELLRVSRKFIIFSFTDPFSTKTFFRKLGGRPVKQATLTVPQINEIVSAKGAKVVAAKSVFKLGSRHRYALINIQPN